MRSRVPAIRVWGHEHSGPAACKALTAGRAVLHKLRKRFMVMRGGGRGAARGMADCGGMRC
jgi:hypothetical protein